MPTLFVSAPGPTHNLQIGGVRLLGADSDTVHKLVFTLVFIVLLYFVRKTLQALARWIGGREGHKGAFWVRQGVGLLTFVIAVLGLGSIWFDNPTRLATGVGLVGAGLAFTLQKVVTSFAGYFVILRGNTFDVGDRIKMGGIRGDVISLNFMQTVIMEMGQPPSVQSADPGMWVQSRQFSGRIVSVTNSTIFDEPVFNYTRDFPFIWEEIHIPITYKADRELVEKIMLESARKETVKIDDIAAPMLKNLEEKFSIERADIEPEVYMRLTDNWVEMSVRFLCKDHHIRRLKSRMSKDIISQLDLAGIGIASSTYDIVGMPALNLQTSGKPSSTAKLKDGE